MIFFMIALLIYIVLNICVIRHMENWLACCHTLFRRPFAKVVYILFYTLLASGPVIALLLPASDFQIALAKFSNYWMGVFIYILLALLVAKLVVLILKIFGKMPRRASKDYKQLCRIGGLTLLPLIAGISIYGAVHTGTIKTKEYQITIHKQAGELSGLRIGLISDLHLGYSVGKRDVEKVVRQLNSANLDLICIAGDIYDNDYDTIDHPEEISRLFSGLQSTYGTFACYGNHDISEKLLGGFTFEDKGRELRDPRVDKMLEDGGITILNDEVRLIERSFYLAGRLDASKTGVSGLKQKTITEFTKTLEPDKPILVMEHQPGDLANEAEANVDLSMAGHTHNGQIFPINLLIKLFWKNPYGLYENGDFHSVVTSGVGTWGPHMRVGTNSEVVIIDVTFSE
ncbi:metallophosphoesterase [Novisyntrophococcus fermenticellae]|uniref:metallophosphoesterase n=1 Tax=Novisyntrophococcus fermenticellae TaxID=2068655 RepID=UPI001E484F4D|nr:metallophosphoesterase [Novisyntrophococcus fermenticellae]